MKTFTNEDFERAGKALAAAYNGKDAIEEDKLWQARLMKRIRSTDLLYPKLRFFDLFQGLVWRLSPAAFVLMCLLALFISRFDFLSGYEVSKILAEDPADFGLLSIYAG